MSSVRNAFFHSENKEKVLFFILACFFLLIFSQFPVLDYHYYADAARSWLDGSSALYDSKTSHFYYLPWTLIFLVPLSFLPDNWGQAILNLISVSGLIWGVKKLLPKISFSRTALSIVNPFTISILILGQWDAIIVIGVVLAWQALKKNKSWLLGLAVCIICTKPNNVILPILLFIIGIRNWPLKDILITFFPIISIILISTIFFGTDWPIRYLKFIKISPPLGHNISLWKIGFSFYFLILLSIPILWSIIYLIIKNDVNENLICYSLVANLIISPYVVPYHFVYTVPALAILAASKLRIFQTLWVVSTILFLMFLFQQQIRPSFYLQVYPVILLAIIFLLSISHTSQYDK